MLAVTPSTGLTAGRQMDCMPAPNSSSLPARPIVLIDGATGLMLGSMILFAPWAFGTTQPWAMQAMNAGGLTLGGLLLMRLALDKTQALSDPAPRLTRALVAVTVLVLGYCLVAAWNAEFTYLPREWRLEAHDHIRWLPHSLDRMASWRFFWNALALASVFWAAYAWMLGDVAPDGRRRSRRLRLLIWLLAANGALVAFEGILQRIDGTPKLLWFKPTHDNPMAEAQFGPFAYRANAAQFFNLIWPAALGLWWNLHFQGSRRSQRHQWLLPCIMLLIAAPLVSISRGGVAVTLVQIAACAGLLLSHRSLSLAPKLAVVLVFLLTLASASYVGWDRLAQRLEDTAADPLRGRSETYHLAERMVEDYPWLGIGPGAFDSTFQVYRHSPADYWPAQLHNDWLEYRITFGAVGLSLLLLALGLVFVRWFRPGGLWKPWPFTACLWIAIAGCLLHARFDFPLQIYSIQFVFVLLCAVLFSISRPARA